MAQKARSKDVLRFKPGDMARVVHSLNKKLLRQIVVIEEWRPEFGRWAVFLTAGPVSGIRLVTGLPILTNRYGFKDSSLEPIEKPSSSTVFQTSNRQLQELASHPSESI